MIAVTLSALSSSSPFSKNICLTCELLDDVSLLSLHHYHLLSRLFGMIIDVISFVLLLSSDKFIL